VVGLGVRADQCVWAGDLPMALLVEPDSRYQVGPMKGGVLDALRHAKSLGSEWVLVVACGHL
jgi:molybdopterin-guanine dinucleotide biosynthesis protein A